jgi:hypothetical protein
VIYVMWAGDLNARPSNNLAWNAVDSEGECKILRIQMAKMK